MPTKRSADLENSNSNTSAIIAMLVTASAEAARGVASISGRLDAVEAHKARLEQRLEKLEISVQAGNEDTKRVLDIVSATKWGIGMVRWLGGIVIAVAAAWSAFHLSK